VLRAEIAVVADDFPVEEDVFEFRSLADVVNDHPAVPRWRFVIHDEADVEDSAAEIPSNHVARDVVLRLVSNGK